jgi:hypothetical protein
MVDPCVYANAIELGVALRALLPTCKVIGIARLPAGGGGVTVIVPVYSPADTMVGFTVTVKVAGVKSESLVTLNQLPPPVVADENVKLMLGAPLPVSSTIWTFDPVGVKVKEVGEAASDEVSLMVSETGMVKEVKPGAATVTVAV